MPAHALIATPFAREEAARRRDAAAPDDPDRLRGAALAARLAEHHARVRRALPYAVALLAKVAARHRARNAKLAVLGEAGEELAEALEGWLEEEERDLLPALRAEAQAGDAVPDELRRTARRHGELGLRMARVRWLADDFALPAWSGRSYQALMEELQGLEQTLLEHLRLERSALGPRQDDGSREPRGDRPEARARLEPAPGEARLQARAAAAPDAG